MQRNILTYQLNVPKQNFGFHQVFVHLHQAFLRTFYSENFLWAFFSVGLQVSEQTCSCYYVYKSCLGVSQPWFIFGGYLVCCVGCILSSGWMIMKVTRLQKMLLKKCNQILIVSILYVLFVYLLFLFTHCSQGAVI